MKTPTILISGVTLANPAERKPFSLWLYGQSISSLTNRRDKIPLGAPLLLSAIQNLRTGCLTRIDIAPNLLKLRLGDQWTSARRLVVSGADFVLLDLILEDRQELVVHRRLNV